jgi:hypothetical protein
MKMVLCTVFSTGCVNVCRGEPARKHGVESACASRRTALTLGSHSARGD